MLNKSSKIKVASSSAAATCNFPGNHNPSFCWQIKTFPRADLIQTLLSRYSLKLSERVTDAGVREVVRLKGNVHAVQQGGSTAYTSHQLLIHCTRREIRGVDTVKGNVFKGVFSRRCLLFTS